MDFFNSHLGEFAALFTAIFWTITALAVESASSRIGSLSVNIIRLFIGFVFLSVFTLVKRGYFLPVDADIYNWIWLSLSGLVGFTFGDLFLFKSYAMIGSRFSSLIMTLVPPITAFFSFIIIGERLTWLHSLGMIMTLTGISMAIFTRDGKSEKISLKFSPRGIIYALGGAIGQALGLVLSKIGLRDYDPFAATQIRIIAGLAGYSILITILIRWKSIFSATSDKKAMTSSVIAAFFGPFLGVSLSLVAVKFTEAGIASTIMSLVPVFIIIPAIIFYKQKVTFIEILGAIVSVIGTVMFFI
jgi:drug/metabolite transporter (DMT)-like permease